MQNGVPYHHVHATSAAAREWLPRMAKEQGADFDAHPNIEVTEYIYDMADRMAAADLIIISAAQVRLPSVSCAYSAVRHCWCRLSVCGGESPGERTRALERRAAAVFCSRRTPIRRCCTTRFRIC